MNKWLCVVAAGLFLCVARPLCAQTGCSDSPENPTAILVLVGSAGAITAGWRARLRR